MAPVASPVPSPMTRGQHGGGGGGGDGGGDGEGGRGRRSTRGYEYLHVTENLSSAPDCFVLVRSLSHSLNPLSVLGWRRVGRHLKVLDVK